MQHELYASFSFSIWQLMKLRIVMFLEDRQWGGGGGGGADDSGR